MNKQRGPAWLPDTLNGCSRTYDTGNYISARTWGTFSYAVIEPESIDQDDFGLMRYGLKPPPGQLYFRADRRRGNMARLLQHGHTPGIY